MTDNIMDGDILNLDLVLEYRERFGDTYSTYPLDGFDRDRVEWVGKQMRRALDGKRAPVTDEDVWGRSVVDINI